MRKEAQEAQLIGQSTDLTINRFSLRVPTRPPGWIVSRLFPVRILSAMLVSSQLYHLLPDGIPKNHFFRLLGPTSLYTVLISYPDLGTRLFYA